MPSPAAELRAAADKLRRLAAAATQGPWEGVVDDHGRKGIDASVWADSIGYYVTEKISSGARHTADATYIAAMHPGVGIALADWLDEQAQFDQLFREGGLPTPEPARALAVARQILGTTGQQPEPATTADKAAALDMTPPDYRKYRHDAAMEQIRKAAGGLLAETGLRVMDALDGATGQQPYVSWPNPASGVWNRQPEDDTTEEQR